MVDNFSLPNITDSFTTLPDANTRNKLQHPSMESLQQPKMPKGPSMQAIVPPGTENRRFEDDDNIPAKKQLLQDSSAGVSSGEYKLKTFVKKIL